MDANQIVDLERYPIVNIDDAAARTLIDTCRQDLDEMALCTLPGFIRAEALPALVDEAQTLVPKAYRNDNLRTPYGWMCNRNFPPEHPRSQIFRNRCSFVLADQFSGDGPIQCLFRWDPLTNFVREALGYKTLYRSACPHLSLNLGIAGEGDQFGWHFDTNDGVVSLLLQQPDEGGHFEYAPYIRDENNESYSQVFRLFAGEPEIVRRVAMAPGTFVLFKGRRSCHRVTPVGPTDRPRLIALFSYDERPGMVFSEASVRNIMNHSPETYYGQPC